VKLLAASKRYGGNETKCNVTLTSGCQNSWRKTAFQCTVTDGTFVK
jgi:hypothetical protein